MTDRFLSFVYVTQEPYKKSGVNKPSINWYD